MNSKRNSNQIVLGLISMASAVVVGFTGCARSSDNPAVVGASAVSANALKCASTISSDAASQTWGDNAQISFVAIFQDNSNCTSGNEALMQVSYPRAVAVDGNGNVYVSDRAGVKVFDTVNGVMKTFAAGVTDARGVGVDANGNVYIADGNTKGIVVYSAADVKIGTIGAGQSANPQGIAIDKNSGTVYLADTISSVVRVYNNGAYVDAIRNSALRLPTQVAVNSAGDIYVVNQGPNKVMYFGPDRSYKGAFAPYGTGPGTLHRPKGIAIDSEDHVYVTDSVFSNYQIFSADGILLLDVGATASGAGNFTSPSMIAIDANDRIYVADQGAGRIQVFQFNGANG